MGFSDGGGANSNHHRHVTTLYFLQTLNFVLLIICIFYVVYKSNIREIWLTTTDEGRKYAVGQQEAGVARPRRHISNNEVNQDDGTKYEKVMENGIKFEGYPIDPFIIPNNQNEWSHFVNACFSLKNFCTSSTFFNTNKDRQNENMVELKGTVTSINENSPNTVQDQAVVEDDGEPSNDVATVVPMQEQNMNKYHHADVKNSKSTENENIVFPLQTKSKFRKRKKCFIDKIGLPLEIGHRKVFYGTWMRDGKPKRDSDADKRFVMEHFSGIMLHEYASLAELSHQPDATPTRTIQLPYMYDGTSHAMYGGALYYHRAGLPNIVRFDLETNQTKELTIEGASFTGSSYLYADNPENYFDLEVDENGLWLIFKYKNVEHLSIARLHPKTLQVLRVWNLTQLNARTVGNAWITCGILYAIRSSRAQNTNMFVAYDLYRRKYASVDMPWTNPYGNANMVSYNPIDRKIYTYDNGHLMTIPLLLSFDTDIYSIS